MTDKVKGFGCRQAYESLSCRNRRSTVDVYGDFDFRLMSAMARPFRGSAVIEMSGPLREVCARLSRLGVQSDTFLSVSMITMCAAEPLPETECPRFAG